MASLLQEFVRCQFLQQAIAADLLLDTEGKNWLYLVHYSANSCYGDVGTAPKRALKFSASTSDSVTHFK
jgi:hypothetical protein